MYVCMYVSMYVSTYRCMYVCMYVCICIVYTYRCIIHPMHKLVVKEHKIALMMTSHALSPQCSTPHPPPPPGTELYASKPLSPSSPVPQSSKP